MQTRQVTLRSQAGVSLSGLLIAAVLLIFASLLAFKVVPPYMEFSTAKKAIIIIAQEKRGGSVADIRKAWQLRNAIDDVKSVSDQDLEITKDGGDIVISFAYKKEIPLFWNVGLYIDFAASSKD